MRTVALLLFAVLAVGCSGTAEPEVATTSREMLKFKSGLEAVIDHSRFILKRVGDNVSMDESDKITEELSELVAACHVPEEIKDDKVDGKPVAEALERLQNSTWFVSQMAAAKFRDGEHMASKDDAPGKPGSKAVERIKKAHAEIDRVTKQLTERYLD